MRKNIKNYTTKVSIEKTVNEIQKLLSSKGAEKIMTEYDSGEPIGITFLLKAGDKMMPVRLPARIDGVERAFYKNKRSRYTWQAKSPLTNAEKKQAKKTAWRNVKDWVDAQLALIEAEMVKFEEVFLPYIVISNRTIFEHFESGNLLQSGK